MVRLAVARLQVCCNSFNPLPIRASDVAAREWLDGPAALAAAQPGSELDGLADFLAARPGWDAAVLRAAAAPPGGRLTAEVFARWLADVEAGLRRGRFDAVYLALHGAAQAEDAPEADLTILRRVRAAAGRLPVVASFSPLANLSEEVPSLLDGACAGRAWPPGDGAATARRALSLLERLLGSQRRPVGAVARVAALRSSLGLPPHLATLWREEAGRLDRRVLDASLLAGFPWADGPNAGASALAWTDGDAGLAQATAAHLAQALEAAPAAPMPWRGEAALTAGIASGAPFALLDPADDPLVGGLADTPEMLRLLAVSNLPGLAALGVLHDPQTLTAAFASGHGRDFDADLGGRATAAFGSPVRLPVRVERLVQPGIAWGDGAGALAVLRFGQLAIIVSEHRPPRVSEDLFLRAGLKLDTLRLVALKAGAVGTASTVADWAARFPELLACAFPGPAAHRLAALPFAHVAPARR